MNMAKRALTADEVRKLMTTLGWDLMMHSADRTMLSWAKSADGVTLHCKLTKQGDEWYFQYTHLPGVQMLVSVQTAPASFPHPKFERWERRMRDYARACEAVAASH